MFLCEVFTCNQALLTPEEMLFLCIGFGVIIVLSAVGFVLGSYTGGKADNLREKLYWDDVERSKRKK